MFKKLYKKLFKHDRKEKLELILEDLNSSIRNIKTEFETSANSIETLTNLYESKLKSEKLLKSIYAVSMTLFKNDLDTALLETLKIITSQGCCQKAFIFKNNFTKNHSCSQKMSGWCNTNNSKNSKIMLFDWNDYPNWKNKLIHGLSIYGNKINFESKNTQKLLSDLEIESVMVLPIFLNKKWWGSLFLGTTNSKEWSNSEIDVCSSICNIIGTSIKRNELQVNSKICQNGSINFLKDIAENIDGVAFWMKDIHNRYVFADKFLIDLIYPNNTLSEIIGRTDYQIMLNDNNIIIDPLNLSKISCFEDLKHLNLSDYNQVEICNITDQITQHFNMECNFFEKIGNKYFEVLKVPLLRQKTRAEDQKSIERFTLTGTAGALVDVTDKKEKKLSRLAELVEQGIAIRIGNTDNYFLQSKLFPVGSNHFFE